MRNKVDVRAFCVEQVVKMKFVDQCDAEKVVQEAKILESYIVGDAHVPEFVDDTSELVRLVACMGERLGKATDEARDYPFMGCLKPNEA